MSSAVFHTGPRSQMRSRTLNRELTPPASSSERSSLSAGGGRGLDIAREYGVADLEDGEWVVGDVSRLEGD